MPSVFLDTNIYSYAATDGQAERVRAWLDRGGYKAVASIVNLIELARTGDRGQAIDFVRALTGIAREEEVPPFTMHLAEEFMEAIKRHRPTLAQAAGWASRAKRLRACREKWKGVRASPEQAFVGLPEFDRHHQPLEQGLFDQQAQVAKVDRDPNVISIEVAVPPPVRRLIGDQVADRLDALPAAERFVRLASLEEWAAAVFTKGKTPNDLRDWIDGHIKPMDERALAEFWLNEVTMSAVPQHAIRNLVRHLQPTRTVKKSNRNDLDQANWMLRVDLVVTADKRFFEVLIEAREQLRSWVPATRLARLGLLERPGDTLAGLQGAFASSR